MTPVSASLGNFVGRARELDEIQHLLAEPDLRLLTLTGPGGIGKTRVALEAARLADSSRFPDGAVFISLASIRESDQLAGAIGGELGVVPVEEQSREQALFAFLAEKRVLLVLDNFEQVIEGRDVVAQLLDAAPALVILITSQRALELPGERALPILEMAPPSAGPSYTAADLAANDAAQLFELYARTANPTFAITDANAGSVAEICRTLEGVPLALELAAARIRSTDPATLLTLLTPRLGFLRRDEGDHPERQRTLGDAINWSYRLLTPRQQRLLRRLAVFFAGFTAEWVAAIGPGVEIGDGAKAASFGALSPSQTLHDDLEALVKSSLLRFELSPAGSGRYRMLGTVREFGLAELAAAGEVDDVHRAFVAAVVAFVEELKPRLRGEDAALAIGKLETEHPNIESALQWSIAQGEAGSEDALRICTAIWSFWKQRGYLREAERYLRQAIEAAGKQETFNVGNGHLLLGHTVLDQRFGWTCYERALDIYRRVGSVRHVAGTLNSLGQTAIYQGDYRRAKALLQETLKFFERPESETTTSDIAHVHYQLGTLHGKLRENDAAIRHLDEARLLWEDAGQVIDVINAIIELGHVYTDQERFEIALDHLNWALARSREVSDFDAEVRALCELGLAKSRMGDDAVAFQHLRSALEMFHQHGYVFGTVVPVVEAIAFVASEQQQPALSAMLMGFADNWRRKSGMGVHPWEVRGRSKTMDQARRALGAQAFDAAFSKGQRLLQLGEIVQAVSQMEIAPGTESVRVTRAALQSKLTKREHEVLCLLATGLKYRDIGAEMGVREPTVKKFVERIYDALDVNNRTAATAYAFQHGLCQPPG